MNITDYAKIINAHIRVGYNAELHNGVWQARFEHCEVMQNGFLVGEWGSGRTPDSAIKNYAAAIAGKRIVFNAYDDRREFIVPDDLTHG